MMMTLPRTISARANQSAHSVTALLVIAVVLASSTAYPWISPAHADQAAEVVHFPSVKGEPINLVGHIRRPEGAGPFPAVVLLHGCAGDWRGMDSRWGARLIEWGYVALSVDSYSPRGIESVCAAFPSAIHLTTCGMLMAR
jgi:hypothetical protein